VVEAGSIEWALSTTRAVRRRLDFDRDVDVEVVLECLDLALQAPTGGDAQGWRWIVITQPATKAKIRDIYVDALGAASGGRRPDRSGSTADRMLDDAWHLATHLDRVPVLVVACIRGRLTPDSTLAQTTALLGSIYPAVWSLQLALRGRRLASVMTTVHLQRHEAMAELLGIPDGVTQAALVPIAHLIGEELRPARRRPVRDVAFPDRWGAAWETFPGPPADDLR
jgi:nitroreductase